MTGFDNYEAYKYNMYANVSAHNDTRWATDDEIKNSLREIVINDYHYPCGGMPLLSDGKVAYVDSSDTHSLILGATGSKKTRLLCMPLLQILAKAGESIIATDPKGELYERTSGILKKNGYKLVVLNFRNPSCGDAWNPLALPYQFYQAGEKDKAAEILNDFVYCNITNENTDPFWEQTAGNFCFGLLWFLLECAREEEVNVRSLAFLRTYAKAFENDGPLDILYNFLNKQSLAAISLSGTLNSTDRTRSSILVTFDQMFRIFSAQQNLSEMLSHSSFNLDQIGLEKTAVFLIMPDEKSTYHFLVSIFIKQCYESLIRVAQEQPSRTLPIRTNFVLDEFANIPAVPDMPSMISAARSRNIRFNLVVQSEHQLRKKYFEDAQTIKGNCDNWVFLTSRELPLLQEISELCGRRKRITEPGFDALMPLISVSQLQRLSKERGEALVFHGRQYPYITLLADIDQYEFEYMAPVLLQKRVKHPVPVFKLKSFLQHHTEEELAGLFSDECSGMPDEETEIPEVDEEEITDEELEKRFDELFNIE